ncbi:MAG: glycosyltransferase family 4 protein [Gammaproteobacteria bacterium]
MKVFVYAEDLAGYTSSIPSREMLKRLVRLRPDDHFILAIRKGTRFQSWWKDYLDELNVPNREVLVLERDRRWVNFRMLAGFPDPHAIKAAADLYLRFDAGDLGARCKPLVSLIADLSSFDAKTSSLAWHGRVLFRKAVSSSLRNSARIVTISDWTRADLVNKVAGVDENRISVIRNGIARVWFENAGLSGVEKPGYWVWYGQITPRKNLDRLLQAYARLLVSEEGGHAPRLRLIGSLAHDGERVVKAIEGLGLNEIVDLLPPQPLDSLVRHVAGSRGLVFPSLHEGFGMPVVEAMACGRPVLTSDVTSMPEVAGGLAALCDPLNVESIEAALKNLLNPGWDEECARRTRREWAKQFTAEAAASAYSALIDEVTNDKAV